MMRKFTIIWVSLLTSGVLAQTPPQAPQTRQIDLQAFTEQIGQAGTNLALCQGDYKSLQAQLARVQAELNDANAKIKDLGAKKE